VCVLTVYGIERNVRLVSLLVKETASFAAR